MELITQENYYIYHTFKDIIFNFLELLLSTYAMSIDTINFLLERAV